jgi:hypothetical protein
MAARLGERRALRLVTERASSLFKRTIGSITNLYRSDCRVVYSA